MANCIHCDREIILNPSASERAKKYGGKASDYAQLFIAHAECTVKYRNQSARNLLDK